MRGINRKPYILGLWERIKQYPDRDQDVTPTPDAIVINFAKMGQALLLGLLFMYSWMVLGLVTLRPQHSTDLCGNMVGFFMWVPLKVQLSTAEGVWEDCSRCSKAPR